jgi:putative FmdB family regulatory protein
MPTYEYECKKCGHNFEVFQAMSDEPLKTCAQCGGEIRRLIFGGAGVIFKGSGFYVTDRVADKSAGKVAGAGGKTSKTESKTTETSGTAQSTSASSAGGDAAKAAAPAGDSGAKPPAASAAQTSTKTA